MFCLARPTLEVRHIFTDSLPVSFASHVSIIRQSNLIRHSHGILPSSYFQPTERLVGMCHAANAEIDNSILCRDCKSRKVIAVLWWDWITECVIVWLIHCGSKKCTCYAITDFLSSEWVTGKEKLLMTEMSNFNTALDRAFFVYWTLSRALKKGM